MSSSQGNGSMDNHPSPVEEFVSRIVTDAEKVRSKHHSASIYTVPTELLRLNKRAYTPRLVSVGPLHRKDKHLKSEMQKIKSYCAYALFFRLCHDETKDHDQVLIDIFKEINECKLAMKSLIRDPHYPVSECYYQNVVVDEEMLVVDGCFVLEVLYRNSLRRRDNSERRQNPSKRESESEKFLRELLDPIFCIELTRLTLRQDLMLLENQLPFSVLSELFNRTVNRLKDPPSDSKTIDQLATSYWGNFLDLEEQTESETKGCSSSHCCIPISGGKKSKEETESETKGEKPYHMLHLLHKHYSQHFPKDHKDTNSRYDPKGKRPMPCASDLHCAGIKFVSDTGNNQSKIAFVERKGLLGWFHRPRFHIPIRCKERTESMLRNLIAFEQLCPGIEPYFTSYAFLMDALIDTEEDVKLLEDAKVMKNYLKSRHAATNLYNNLCTEHAIRWEEFCFATICKGVDEYSKRPWPKVRKWPAWLALYVKRTYLSTPWALVGFCLAFLAVGLQIGNFITRFVT